jgi:hypothetical protein
MLRRFKVGVGDEWRGARLFLVVLWFFFVEIGVGYDMGKARYFF